MRLKFSSIVVLFVVIFIAKISFDNMNNVQANEVQSPSKIQRVSLK